MHFQSDADKFQHFLDSGNCHLGEFGPTNYGRSIKSGPPNTQKVQLVKVKVPYKFGLASFVHGTMGEQIGCPKVWKHIIHKQLCIAVEMKQNLTLMLLVPNMANTK